jgi:hypothetical protein
MNGSNLLYNLVCFFLGGLIVYVFKPFFGSYSAKKGENLATKEDIAQITKSQEEIKAQISDNVWDRQEQWKLKRDLVFDFIRALADLDRAINEFGNAFSFKPINPSEDLNRGIKEQKAEAARLHMQCSTTFQRAHTVADIAIHGALSRAISAYFQRASVLLLGIHNETAQYDSNARLELAKLHNAVIIAARNELGVHETDDLPVLDYENLSCSSETDNCEL